MTKFKTNKKNFTVKNILTDIVVGIVIALISIPISMGYALVAGLPVIYGLYGSLLPILAYAFLTSSPRYIFGVDAAPAALTGGVLLTLSITNESERAIKIVPVITLITAIWLIIFYIVRADRIIKYISESVMGGFITGIGMTIILMQVPKLFGGDSGMGELSALIAHIYTEAGEGFHLLSFALGISTIIIILICKKLFPKAPMAAIMMIGGACLTKFMNIDKYGVKLLPDVKSGLPKFVLPDVTLLIDNTGYMFLSALIIALVIFSETLLATKNFGNKHDDKIDNRREILAYSVGNLIASLSGCCPVNGSVSRTGLAEQYGIKSQLASIVASLSMFFVLMFGTGFIPYLPVPVLTAIVISALIGTFEFSLASKLRKTDKTEFWIFMTACLTVLVFGTIYGVLIGVVLSSVTFIIRQARPTTDFLGCIEGVPGFYSLKRNSNAHPLKHTVIYRFNGAVFYANVDIFIDSLKEEVTDSVRYIVVDMSGVGSVDYTACEKLKNLYRKYAEKGVSLVYAGHSGDLNDQFRKYGASELIMEGAVASTIQRGLRNIGIVEPYILTTSDRGKTLYHHSASSHHIAEFEWAFGEVSYEKLEELTKETLESDNPIAYELIKEDWEYYRKTIKNSKHEEKN